jgi:hypothetical protein
MDVVEPALIANPSPAAEAVSHGIAVMDGAAPFGSTGGVFRTYGGILSEN